MRTTRSQWRMAALGVVVVLIAGACGTTTTGTVGRCLGRTRGQRPCREYTGLERGQRPGDHPAGRHPVDRLERRDPVAGSGPRL